MTVKDYNEKFQPRVERAECFVNQFESAIRHMDDAKVDKEEVRYHFAIRNWDEETKQTILAALKCYDQHEGIERLERTCSEDKNKPKPLSIYQLERFPLKEWVWIEIFDIPECKEKESGYFRKQADYTHGQAFCCGYPGISFSFYYEEYGKTWSAYTHKPCIKEKL